MKEVNLESKIYSDATFLLQLKVYPIMLLLMLLLAVDILCFSLVLQIIQFLPTQFFYWKIFIYLHCICVKLFVMYINAIMIVKTFLYILILKLKLYLFNIFIFIVILFKHCNYMFKIVEQYIVVVIIKIVNVA